MKCCVKRALYKQFSSIFLSTNLFIYLFLSSTTYKIHLCKKKSKLFVRRGGGVNEVFQSFEGVNPPLGVYAFIYLLIYLSIYLFEFFTYYFKCLNKEDSLKIRILLHKLYFNIVFKKSFNIFFQKVLPSSKERKFSKFAFLVFFFVELFVCVCMCFRMCVCVCILHTYVCIKLYKKSKDILTISRAATWILWSLF